jgi:hypothetical protein
MDYIDVLDITYWFKLLYFKIFNIFAFIQIKMGIKIYEYSKESILLPVANTP